MKCVRCHADSNYKDRAGGKCPSCHKPFAFEPKSGDPVTDMAFKTAIDRVSSDGRVKWNPDHLYFELSRRMRKRVMSPAKLVVAGLAAAGLVAASMLGAPAFLGFVGAALVAAVLVRNAWVYYGGQRARLERDAFERLWLKWTRAHGTPPGLIVRKTAPPARREVEKDLPDYSFDRAVICDRPGTVDLLLANNFHFENNCAVLSIDGYPEGPFETVRAMLKRNPRLQVFALHDASVAGCTMARRLARDRAWFAGGARVTDVGLRPSHVKPFRGLYTAPDRAAGPDTPGLTRTEAAWLAEHSLELAAVRPEQVLKRLYRAIARREDEVAARGDGGGGDGGSAGDGGGDAGGDWSGGSPGGHAGAFAFGSDAGHGDFGGGGASDDFGVDADSFGSDAGDSDGGADGFG